ncbi:MAG: hypothetical protein GY870_10140 [archaeon]|nr:hypothetical protein [archaeon]
MKNLEMYGVQEMNANEMKKTDGGFVFWAALGVAVITACVVEVIGDWDNFKAGLAGKCES